MHLTKTNHVSEISGRTFYNLRCNFNYSISEAYVGHCVTSVIELFTKTVYDI